MDNVSLIIPVHNEEKTLKENSIKLFNYMWENCPHFEILLCDNGSTDKTYEISKELNKKYGEIKPLKSDEKGIGVGIKLGIDNAKYDTMMFYAIDLPFGLNVIRSSYSEMYLADIVIGSKAHKKSQVERTFKRTVFSAIYNFFIRLFFGLKVKDTQGSLMFRKSDITNFISRLDSKDAFFETQILINAKRNKFRFLEVPVKMSYEVRQSKIRPIQDGMSMLLQIVRERLRR